MLESIGIYYLVVWGVCGVLMLGMIGMIGYGIGQSAYDQWVYNRKHG